MTLRTEYSQGSQINLVPPSGHLPLLADVSQGMMDLILRPERHLRVETAYLLDRLMDRTTGASVFNNHIVRSTWVWQFNKRLALRVIPQYSTVLANPAFTSLATTKNFNADFLVTYLVNPFTALYVGYNGNMDNLQLLSNTFGNQLLRTQGLAGDGHQLFVKVSYLLRF